LTNERLSFFSQIYHFVRFSLKKPKLRFENAMFITSIDIDVGSSKVGAVNKGRNDSNVHDTLSEYTVGEIEEQALPLFVKFFEEMEAPVTFAIRGQLLEVTDLPVKMILESSVKHDVGSHGYYHRNFQTLSNAEADNELALISEVMKNLGITPKSFVFPKNMIAHLQLLEKWGYECFRGYGDFLNDDMRIDKQGLLYNVRPSIFLGQCVSPFLLGKIVDISVKNKLPFHVWFHIWDFGETVDSIQKRIKKVFYPLYRYVKKKEAEGTLTFETMYSATQKTKNFYEK